MDDPRITATKNLIEMCPDFPKKGVTFISTDLSEHTEVIAKSLDEEVGEFLGSSKSEIAKTRNLFPVLRNPAVFKGLVDCLTEDIKSKYPDVEVVVGLDSRGFLFGPLIAQNLGIVFVPVRKKGKLPGDKYTVEYSLEYGSDSCEIQKNSIKEEQKVVIIDDLLATGGTMKAACDLMEMAKAKILACVVVIELKDLNGKNKLNYPLLSYIS